MPDKMDELLTGFYKFKKSMENRIESIDGRFDKLEKNMDTLAQIMKKRFDKVDEELSELSLRIGTVRRMSGENMRDIEAIKEKVGL